LRSVSAIPIPFPDLVSIHGSTSRTDQRPNHCAFLSAREAADPGAAQGGSGNRQFITVFLPESAMTMSITGLVCVGNRLDTEGKCQEHQDNRHKLFHFAECHSISHQVSPYLFPIFGLKRAMRVPVEHLVFSTKLARNAYS
jgi:hypothetical protein